MFDKRMSVFTHTYAGSKSKKNKDSNVYNFMIDSNHIDLNKTFDMINSKINIDNSDTVSRNKMFKNSFTQQIGFKPHNKPYINTLISNPVAQKDPLIKQKPAAPEITQKSPLSVTNNNMTTSMSDSSMIQYSNASSTKFFNRPKSMERIKRK